MMLTPAPILADRARWHYLFPEGLQEVYPSKGGDVLTKYTPALCRKMVETFNEARAIGRQFGMPAQPIPVQLQHVGVTNADVPAADKRRFASCYALHYHPKGDAIPAGVWGLVEWTEEGWDLVSTRRFNALSPTTVSKLRVASGKYLPGPALVEIGLVDVPFLEGIGTALDCLPADAFPYVGDRTMEGAASLQPPAAPRSYPDGYVLTRGAQHRSVPMEEEKVEFELSPDKLTPEVVKAIMESETARAMCRAMCREYMEAELDGALESRGMMKREAVASPTIPASEAIGDVATPAADAILSAARAKETELLRDEVLGHVTARRLLAARTGEYMTRRAAGQPIDDLLGDYTGLSRSAGAAGVGAASDKAPVTIQKRSAASIVDGVEKRLKDAKRYDYAEHLRLANEEIATARAKGELVEA
jgi:hypothetical protein